jgi:uncharacterized protein YifN (PemK superfamily)
VPLIFQPKAKSIVVCDFKGFVVPEMVKKRPCIVIAKHRENSKLVTVVPMSTTAPATLEDYHCELVPCPIPGQPAGTRVWAKCDMVYTVSIDRLELWRSAPRVYVRIEVTDADFQRIKDGVRAGLHLRPPTAFEANQGLD